MTEVLPRPQIRKKSIRSFVIRAGRLTEGQRRALQLGWPSLGLDLDAAGTGFIQAFERQAPRVFEIGYGMGHSLVVMAECEPDKDFVGIEVHPPGVGSLIHATYDFVRARPRLPNLKTYMADAVDVLREAVPHASLHRVQIYFPDPWHKKKHHKRRLIQPELVSLLVDRLEPGGVLHLATDWAEYAEYMFEVLEAEPGLENCAEAAGFFGRPAWRPMTKFERRGERRGHEVFDLVYRRAAES